MTFGVTLDDRNDVLFLEDAFNILEEPTAINIISASASRLDLLTLEVDKNNDTFLWLILGMESNSDQAYFLTLKYLLCPWV